MANPKRRTSTRRKNQRRAHDYLTAGPVGKCSNCGATRQPHRICGECGFYGDTQVAPAADN